MALLVDGCGVGAVRATVPDVPRAVSNLAATLTDEVRQLPAGQITWTTYWRLCWDEYPGAIAYELQTLTSEGASPKLRRETERCFSLEVAKGTNAGDKGLFNRELMLAGISGLLALRVRAVLGGNRGSAWSASMPVGVTTPQEPWESRPASSE